MFTFSLLTHLQLEFHYNKKYLLQEINTLSGVAHLRNIALKR